MPDALLWVYILNAALLIVHEIDSAYWKEWQLFKLPGGVGFFVLLHIPLVILILLGLVWLYQGSLAGLIFSLVVSLAGIAAFNIHTWFIRKGRPEFKTPVSQSILIAALLVSIVQLALTLYALWRG